MHAAGRRTLPDKPPTGFIRRSWRPFVIKKDGIDRKAYEICALSELRDRLRAGDVWVEESRQSRDFESCLMPRATFDILREEGALPVAVPRSVERHLAERGVELDRIVAEVAGLAEKGGLEDVDLSDGELRVTPIRDTTPPEAEELGRRAYDLMPRVKITYLLLEVDGWHVRDDTYMAALARIIDTHRHPAHRHRPDAGPNPPAVSLLPAIAHFMTQYNQYTCALGKIRCR